MEKENNLLEVIHFDVCSPMSAEACSEYHYVLTSQMIRVDVEYIYLMKHKSELLNGSLNLDRSDTHVHAKRYKIVMIVPPTCGTAT